jgi:hypothetical protein
MVMDWIGFIEDWYRGSVIVAFLAITYATYLDIKTNKEEGTYMWWEYVIITLIPFIPLYNLFATYHAIRHILVKRNK